MDNSEQEHTACKIEWWGVDVVICLERGAHRLHMSSWCRCIPKPHHLLPHLNPYWFYLSSTGIPRLSLKIDAVLAFIPQRTSYTFQRAMDRHMPPEVSLPDGDLVLHVRTCIDGSPCPRESAPKRHFDRFSCFGGILTQKGGPRCSVCSSKPHLCYARKILFVDSDLHQILCCFNNITTLLNTPSRILITFWCDMYARYR